MLSKSVFFSSFLDPGRGVRKFGSKHGCKLTKTKYNLQSRTQTGTYNNKVTIPKWLKPSHE